MNNDAYEFRGLLASSWDFLRGDTSNGTPVSPRNMTRNFKKAITKAGVPEISFHDLRHTAATVLLKEGIHPKIVQELLGHASIVQTMDTYSHVIEGMHAEAAQTMGEKFRLG